jgi:Zn-finger nucleic acid-binding protein
MANCPNCYKTMTTQSVEAHVSTRPVEIDACPGCRLFWFDQWESTSLAPRAVLSLFQYIGKAAGQRPTPLASQFNCARCHNTLDFTKDLQRTTPFTYWRCSLGHGRLITFNQFLREKNFIRAPSPAELARLRATVKQISCSQCGGPIDLANDSACGHCGAPIALVDPDSVAKAIQELTSPQGGAAPSSDANATRQALSDAQIDALFDHERMRERAGHNDLLVIGVEAIGALVGAFLLSR